MLNSKTQSVLRNTCIMGRIALIGAVLFAFLPLCARAQSVSVEKNLSFGRFALLNFQDVQTIDIASNGSFTKSSDIWFVDMPKRGIYNISDAPANTNFTVTLPVGDIVVSGVPGRSMVIKNLAVGSTSFRTDAEGNALFWIYGSLETRGNMSYEDSVYSGDIEFTVDFDE